MSHAPFAAELSARHWWINPGGAPVQIKHNLPNWPAELECMKHGSVWKISPPGSETLVASIAQSKRPGWLAWLLGQHEFRLSAEGREIARIVGSSSGLTLSIHDEGVGTVGYNCDSFSTTGLSWRFTYHPQKGCYLTSETPCQLQAAILAALVLWENCLFSA